MIKKNLFLLLFLSYLFFCRAQEEDRHIDVNTEIDTLCSIFYKSITIDFDVSQKSGCEFLITQLLNQSTYVLEDTIADPLLEDTIAFFAEDILSYFPEDTLSYFWNVFNDDRSTQFEFTEENPDIFLYDPGNYHITLIITNMYGCADTLTKFNVITIDKKPQINFTFTPENALFAEYFGEVEFVNLTDPVLLSDTTVVWYWDMGDKVINLKDRSPVHLFSAYGDYHTTFHLKTKNGCKVALTKTVTIEDELFFSDILKSNSQTAPSVFAVTNLNTHIPKDGPDQFRTNHLFIYNENGKMVYEQKNYDTYIKNNIIVEGAYSLGATDLQEGVYYYSFYYKGKNKMVHYSGKFEVE